jgi:hypothetical protein
MNGETEMTNQSDMQQEIETVKRDLAVQAATQAGAQATQAAVQAGQAATQAASMVGMAAAVIAGAVGLSVEIFLGIAIAKSRWQKDVGFQPAYSRVLMLKVIVSLFAYSGRGSCHYH